MSDRKMLLGLFLSYFAMHCFEQMYFLMGPILETRGISPATTGWILGIFFVGVIACRPIGGWALEHLGVRRTLIYMSAIGFVGGTLVALFYTDVRWLLVGRLLSGISYGGYVVAMLAYQTLVIPEEKRGAAVALITTGGMLPMATITVLGEWLILSGHVVAYFWMGPAMALICMYFGSRIGEEGNLSVRNGGEKRSWGRYRDLLRLPPFMLLVSTAVFLALLDGSVVSIASLAAENNLLASTFFASSAIVGVALRVVASRFIDRMPRKLLLVPAAQLMAFALLLVAFFPSNTTFLIGGVGFGAGIGIGFPMMLSMVSQVLGKKLQPKGTVAVVTTFDMGWVLTPLVLGYLSSVLGTAWAFRLLAFFVLLATTLLLLKGWLPLYQRDRSRGL